MNMQMDAKLFFLQVVRLQVGGGKKSIKPLLDRKQFSCLIFCIIISYL